MERLYQHSYLKLQLRLLLAGLALMILLPDQHVFAQLQGDNWMEKYDTLAQMPEQRYCHAACVIDKKIYVMSGFTGVYYARGKNMIQVYDTETDNWEEVKISRQFDRAHISALSVEGKIYFLGGSQGILGTGRDDVYTFFSLDIWDPETNSWQVRASFPGDNLGPACVLDNKIYMTCGYHYLVGPEKTMYRYDIDKDLWERVADMNTARFFAGMVAHQGKIYVIGGITYETHATGLGDRTCEVYDPETDTWSPGPELPFGRFYLNKHSILSVGNDILSFGAAKRFNSVETDDRIMRLNGRTKQWEFYDSLPDIGATHSAARVGEKIYLMGGWNNGVLKTNISYDFSNLLAEQGTQKKPEVFILFPNPVASQTLIRFSTFQSGDVLINICNSMGNMVKQLDVGSLPVGQHEIPVDLSGLRAGIYVVVIRSDRVESRVLIKE